ncbi:uncharacterized protein BJ171DRAFT_91176 [Polychytrium aggregatum]|uniref:uncharacterized protein n=1 Tax=Polychytrium aggregatum TaxID=110093 RepID=UPI0022FEF8B8|nr:uncharacterized protein BJ171DRAFT_91176 [Polychytrium aggregatum]KAI9204892.1 hypothetical protein BJ171DRAFT_91176 [Polychytrium aggregatum]
MRPAIDIVDPPSPNDIVVLDDEGNQPITAKRRRIDECIDVDAVDPVPAPSSSRRPPSPPLPTQFLEEMFPDVQPVYLYQKLEELDGDVERAVEELMKTVKDLPKRQSFDQRKDQIDFRVVNADVAMSPLYIAQCFQILCDIFPEIPSYYVRTAMAIHNSQFTPTYLILKERLSRPDETRGFLKRKGKQNKRKGADQSNEPLDSRLGREIRPFIPWFRYKPQSSDRTQAPEVKYECGCCCDEYAFDMMTQCEEGHLFCMECANRAAKEAIGIRKGRVKCMDMSSCPYSFTDGELRRFLSEADFEGLSKIRQEEAIRQAGLEGFTECPFCSFGVQLTTLPEEDKLLYCQREECKAVSCRLCKQLNHLPLTCEEYKKDKKLDVQHTVEEQMSEALFRACPKCGKKIIKEDGCNKITCVCGQYMCYVCRKAIKGYDHFNRAGSSCPLHDDAATRVANEVQHAYRAAVDANQIDENDLQIDVPTATNILR